MSNNYPPNQPPQGGNYPNSQQPGPGYPTTPLSGRPQGGPGFPPAGSPPPKKSGMRPLFYILGGCAGLVVVGVIVFFVFSYLVYNKAKRAVKEAGLDPALMQSKPALAAAKTFVALNPDLEIVSTDDNKGLITIRNKKTGETVTMTVDEANKGKVSFSKDGKDVGSVNMHTDKDSASLEFKTNEGTAKFGAGTTDTAPGWVPNYGVRDITWDVAAHTGNVHTGTYHFVTPDGQENVAIFYEAEFKQKGFKVDTATTTSGTEKNTILTYNDGTDDRGGVVSLTQNSGGGTKVAVMFKAKE
ncbi:MAG TPA: proline-rich domain-containing protein [Blastocatellia bacterium]